jgi:hypothetical protein
LKPATVNGTLGTEAVITGNAVLNDVTIAIYGKVFLNRSFVAGTVYEPGLLEKK